MIIAKMFCSSVSRQVGPDGDTVSESVIFHAVHGEDGDNAAWSKATPYAEFKATISNPGAFGQVLPGRYYKFGIEAVEIEEGE